jgi:hypothetical protein
MRVSVGFGVSSGVVNSRPSKARQVLLRTMTVQPHSPPFVILI